MASIKKHVSQMTEEEKTFLLKKAKKVTRWVLSSHLKHRMEERGGSDDKVLEVLEHGSMIEYHQKDGVSRILIRGNKGYHNSVLCVVFQFRLNKIITLYWNNSEDHHSTLREEAYDANVDIIELIQKEEQLLAEGRK